VAHGHAATARLSFLAVTHERFKSVLVPPLFKVSVSKVSGPMTKYETCQWYYLYVLRQQKSEISFHLHSLNVSSIIICNVTTVIEWQQRDKGYVAQ